MTPATSDSGNLGNSAKNMKGLQCSHMVKAVNGTKLRKVLNHTVENVCSNKKSPCPETCSEKWMCLQCGNIGCGDPSGLCGHAQEHQTVPRSDPHCLVILFKGPMDKIWCYSCEVEVDPSNVALKQAVGYLKRNPKIKNALQISPEPVSQTSIALGPPPPPPPPAPKKETLKASGKKNPGRVTSNRWEPGNDWPLGLENLGNTCFMNSALQCLSRTRSLNDKLDLYASGNIIEILVTSNAGEPSIQVVNSDVEKSDFYDNTDDMDKDSTKDAIFSNGSVESSDLGSGELSPSSTEMDSLLDVASGSSSRKSEGTCDSSDKDQWKEELKKETQKPLKLRLSISKDSMASKLRQCFKAVTRSMDMTSPNDDDGFDTSDFHCRINSYPTVYCPRAVQLGVSRHFRLGQQHDSHELLRTVVDMMKKDQIKAFRLGIMQRYGLKKSEGKNCDPKVAELLKLWDRKLYNKTFVDEIFGGELVTFQECLECKSVRKSHEDFLDLSLPIRVFRATNKNKKTYSYYDDDSDYVINRTVDSCLRSYTEPEFLTGSNVVECENCHKRNLERLVQGVPFSTVFPGVKLDDVSSSSNRNACGTNAKSKKEKKRRQSRQSKINAKLKQSTCGAVSTEESSLKLVEDHYKSDQVSMIEEDNKSSKSGSLHDFVIVQSQASVIKRNNVENVENDMEMECDTQTLEPSCGTTKATMKDDEELGETGGSNLRQGLSSSLKSLTIGENDNMDIEACLPADDDMVNQGHIEDEDMQDLMDELDAHAVDGIGNASDVEDEDNGVPVPDLGFEEKPVSATVAAYLSLPSNAVTTSSTMGDEGFEGSESENSLDKQSQSLSASSSRNSISEGDNVTDTAEKTEKKIPITKCPCSRRQLISRPPECLTLHLKRFQHTARGSSKLSDKVDFPYILDLKEFCSEEKPDESKSEAKSIFDEDGEVLYSLYGIVEHSGSLHFGHYVAYVKTPGKEVNGEVSPDKWFYISDSHVSLSSLQSVLSQDAYILFYERIRGREKVKKLQREKPYTFENTDFTCNEERAVPVDSNSGADGVIKGEKIDEFLDIFLENANHQREPSSSNTLTDVSDYRPIHESQDENWEESSDQTQQVSSSYWYDGQGQAQDSPEQRPVLMLGSNFDGVSSSSTSEPYSIDWSAPKVETSDPGERGLPWESTEDNSRREPMDFTSESQVVSSTSDLPSSIGPCTSMTSSDCPAAALQPSKEIDY